MKISQYILALVLLPTLAEAQNWHPEDRPTHVLIGSMMVGHGMDIATTSSCLAIDNCIELNPVLRPLVHKPLAFGGAKMAIATGISAFLLKNHEGRMKWPARLLAGGMTVLLFTVSAKNATLTPPRTTP